MLYHVLFCAILATLVSAHHKGQEVHHLTPPTLLKAQKFSIPCIEETNANHDILGKLLAGTIEHDEPSRNWLWCFTQRGKFLDEKGNFNIPRMSALMEDHPLIKSFEKYLRECNKISKEDPLDTAFAMEACINGNSPLVFSL